MLCSCSGLGSRVLGSVLKGGEWFCHAPRQGEGGECSGRGLSLWLAMQGGGFKLKLWESQRQGEKPSLPSIVFVSFTVVG